MAGLLTRKRQNLYTQPVQPEQPPADPYQRDNERGLRGPATPPTSTAPVPGAPAPVPGTPGREQHGRGGPANEQGSGGLLSRVTRDRGRPEQPGTGQPGQPGQPAQPGQPGPAGPSSDPAAELTRLLSMDSPFLQEARTRGMQYANARGMLNSSIGGAAAEAEAIRAAQPLALQSAGQVAARELSEQQFGQAKSLQAQQAKATKDVAQLNVDANQKIAELDATTKANLAQLEVETQTAIANMQVAASQQANAASAAVGMSGNQAQMWTAVMNNPNIPAAERAKYLTAITATNNANIGLIEQLYNVDLNWATGGAGIPTTTPAAGTNPAVAASAIAGAGNLPLSRAQQIAQRVA